MIRDFFREYFCFTRRERNGTIILAAIMLAVLIFPHLYSFISKPAIYQPDPRLVAEIREFYTPGPHGRHPGGTASSDMEKLPGGFVTITGNSVKMTDSLVIKNQYSFLKEDSLTGNAVGSARKSGSVRQTESLVNKIDLNSADTLDLMKIRGIGPVFSRRILRYRDILGGYVFTEQLREVYGIDEELYQNISPFVFADTGSVVKLRPATGGFGELLRHPYLDYNQVSEIFRIRDTCIITSAEILLQSPAFSESDIVKLRPYMELEQVY